MAGNPLDCVKVARSKSIECSCREAGVSVIKAGGLIACGVPFVPTHQMPLELSIITESGEATAATQLKRTRVRTDSNKTGSSQRYVYTGAARVATSVVGGRVKVQSGVPGVPEGMIPWL